MYVSLWTIFSGFLTLSARLRKINFAFESKSWILKILGYGYGRDDRYDILPDLRSDSKQHEVERYITELGLEGIRTFECKACGKIAELKQNIIRHLKTVHTPREKQICHICSKEFKNIHSLYAHNRRTHPISNEQTSDDTKVPLGIPLSPNS